MKDLGGRGQSDDLGARLSSLGAQGALEREGPPKGGALEQKVSGL